MSHEFDTPTIDNHKSCIRLILQHLDKPTKAALLVSLAQEFMQAEDRPLGEVDPGFISEVFMKIIEDEEKNSRRSPVWYKTFWEVFKEKENEEIPSSAIKSRFNTEQSFHNALTKTRNALRIYGLTIKNVSSRSEEARYRITFL